MLFVEDGKKSDTAVDVTYSNVCHARLKLFQSQIDIFFIPSGGFSIPKITENDM